jgi:hypothetical protein
MMGNIGFCAGSPVVNDCGANSIVAVSIAERAMDRHHRTCAADRPAAGHSSRASAPEKPGWEWPACLARLGGANARYQPANK